MYPKRHKDTYQRLPLFELDQINRDFGDILPACAPYTTGTHKFEMK